MLKAAQARPTGPVREGTGLPRTRDHQHQRTGFQAAQLCAATWALGSEPQDPP